MVSRGSLINSFKYRLLLHKRYFDIGYGFTSIMKYLIALFSGVDAILTGDMTKVFIAGFSYVIFCYLFGMIFIKFGWYEAEQEVDNQYNMFQKEMREKLDKRKSL